MNWDMEPSSGNTCTGAEGVAPGFGVEPGANEQPLEIVVAETDKERLRRYLVELGAIGHLAARRPGARPRHSLFE